MSREILLVEDEEDIASILKFHLEEPETHVTVASNGIDGLTLALQPHWDLIILDLGLPKIDGMDICRQVRSINPKVPIILVTARSSEMERVAGLECGADDYITKPFSISEVMARVKAIFRRIDINTQASVNAPVTAPLSAPLSARDITINPATHAASVNGKPINLTAREFELLLHFVKSPGQVFKRSELLEHVWGYGHTGYLHTVNSHINRLRAKIEPDPAQPRYIQTVWGVGYKLSV